MISRGGRIAKYTWREGLNGLLFKLADCKARNDHQLHIVGAEIVSKTEKPLMKLIRAMGENFSPEDVEVVLNQTYSRMYRSIESYNGESEYIKDKDTIAWTWIKQITKRLVIDRLSGIRLILL